MLLRPAPARAEPAGRRSSLRAEGSFPLQYIETVSVRSRQQSMSAAPYLGLTATGHLQPDLSTSVFANGGHNQLGSFRDNDNTFASSGGNHRQAMGRASAPGRASSTPMYYDGMFGATTNIANDVNVFASYSWKPNPDLRITPGVTATARLRRRIRRCSATATAHGSTSSSGCSAAGGSSRRRGFAITTMSAADAGRRDIAGVDRRRACKYEINESVSVTMLGRLREPDIEHRRQGLRQLHVGASLDFDIDFARPRWPGGR